jgi:hypothetical protein
MRIHTAEQAPHRPGTTPAYGLRATGDVVPRNPQTRFGKEIVMSIRAWLDRFRPRWQQPRQTVPRPRSCPVVVEPLEDRCTPAVLLNIGDVTILEGNEGVQMAEVLVSLSRPHGRSVSVNYSSDDSAVAGKLTIARGETSETILVPVIGDRLVEPTEYLTVTLSGARGARLADGEGVVTILDDEPYISAVGPYTMEGNSGATVFAFTVNLSAAYDEVVTVNFSTQDGTAFADEDYTATSGLVTFERFETSQTILVDVTGDDLPEPDEYFYVQLSGASANAVISYEWSSGTIADDDGYVPPYDPGDYYWYDYGYYDYGYYDYGWYYYW